MRLADPSEAPPAEPDTTALGAPTQPRVPDHTGQDYVMRLMNLVDPRYQRRGKLLNLTALGAMLQIERQRVPEALTRLASIIESGERDSFATLQQALMSLRDEGRISLLNLFLWRKYDETPARLCVRWRLGLGQTPDLEPQAKLLVVERACGQHWAETKLMRTVQGTSEHRAQLEAIMCMRSEMLWPVTQPDLIRCVHSAIGQDRLAPSKPSGSAPEAAWRN